MYEQANQMEEYIFKRPKSNHHIGLLMGLFPVIANLESPLPSYKQFFISSNNNDTETSTFAVQYGLPPWAY